MSRLRVDLRTAALGAFAGVFTFSVFLVVDRVETFNDYLACLDGGGEYCHDRMQTLWWVPFAFWHVLMFVLAGFVAHRYFADRFDSPFMLWQVVGVGALCAWGLSFASAFVVEGAMHGGELPYEWLRGLDLAYVAKFAATVLAADTLCASFFNSAARQYAADSEQ